MHNWLKYKEGFSAQLVESFLNKFGIGPGQRILEPFAGSATTLLVAMELDIDAVGIEILPVCHLAWEAKSRYPEYNATELRQVLQWVRDTEPGDSLISFPHIIITDSFSARSDRGSGVR